MIKIETFLFQQSKANICGHEQCLSPYNVIDIVFLQFTVTTSNPDKSNVVVVVHSSDKYNIATLSSSNYVFNSRFPALEPLPLEYTNTLFCTNSGMDWVHIWLRIASAKLSNDAPFFQTWLIKGAIFKTLRGNLLGPTYITSFKSRSWRFTSASIIL